jgi:hypothetical protein
MFTTLSIVHPILTQDWDVCAPVSFFCYIISFSC